MARKDTKQRILEAAGRVVLERGPSALTLDAVAEEAGLSKGGVLYHFATKEALQRAMVEQLVEVTETRLASHREQESGAGAWVRGYLAACLKDAGAGAAERDRMEIAILAAAAMDPALLEPLREQESAWGEQLRADGLDPVVGLIVRLAADGLWLNGILGLPVLDVKERAAVSERLEAMTRP